MTKNDRSFVIFRHGSNGANQHLCQVMACCTVMARSEAEAKNKARDKVTCYANQYLEAKFATRCKRVDLESAREQDAALAIDSDTWTD